MRASGCRQVKIGESNHLLVYNLRLLPRMTAIIECNLDLIRNVCREFTVNGEKLWMYNSGKHLSTIYLYNKQNIFWNSQYVHLFWGFFLFKFDILLYKMTFVCVTNLQSVIAGNEIEIKYKNPDKQNNSDSRTSKVLRDDKILLLHADHPF